MVTVEPQGNRIEVYVPSTESATCDDLLSAH
jgi:hypothetical protein